ncbi:hypothetical protein J7K42_02950 [bacterium]|nr:hypothetical protein [bacterium]
MIAKFSGFRKRKTKGLFLVILTGFSVVAGVVFLVILNLRINGERAELKSEIENLTRELQEERIKREKLLSKISQAKNIEYLEKVALKDLNLRPEGTKVVAFVAKKKTEGKEKEEKEIFWKKISDWLLKKLKIR